MVQFARQLKRLVNQITRAEEEAFVISSLLDGIAALADAPHLGVYFVLESGAALSHNHGFPSEKLPKNILAGDPFLKRIAGGAPVDAADVRGGILRNAGARMAYPLMVAGRPAHVLLVADTAADASRRAELHEWIGLLVATAAVSVDRLRVRKVIHERQRIQAQNTRLAELARSFGVTATLQPLLKRILVGAVENTRAQKGSLMLLDTASRELVVRVVHGLPDKAVEDKINRGEHECVRLAIGQGVAGTVFESGEKQVIHDVHSSSGFVQAGRSHPGALLCIPIVHQGEKMGVVNLTARKPGFRFDDETVAVATRIAADAAVAIHRTQLFESTCMDQESGLLSGQLLEAVLDSEVCRAQRYGGPLSVVVCHFAFAEPVLNIQALGVIMRRTMRQKIDLAGHFGDGWFGMVLPDTPNEGAKVLCARLAAEIEEDIGGQPKLRFCVTQWGKGEKAGELFNRAMDGLERLGPPAGTFTVQVTS
jgi:GGDEF domain-containing protein